MRELKFRYWDGKSTYISETLAPMNELFVEPDVQAIMQYTGLKDKNGGEIYEGDILRYVRFGWRCPGHPEHNTDLVTYHKVIWDEADYAFKADNKDMTASLCFDDSRAKRNEVEVIGNIYETPALLRGQLKEVKMRKWVLLRLIPVPCFVAIGMLYLNSSEASGWVFVGIGIALALIVISVNRDILFRKQKRYPY